MKLRQFYTLIDDVYNVVLRTEDWSQRDLDLMAKYGEPEIDLGGDFEGPPEFVLTTNLVKAMSDSPFSQSFDGRDYANAEDRANVWATEIISRITSAMTTLRANDDEFTREEVQNV
jgi:hypothetical protein